MKDFPASHNSGEQASQPVKLPDTNVGEQASQPVKLQDSNAGEQASQPATSQTSHAPSSRVPWWMVAIIILCMLPGIGFPFLGNLLASGDVIVKGLTWFYPIYTIVSGFLAWQCYGRRTLMTWVILVLLLMSHGCFYYLAAAAGNLQTFR